MIDKIEAYQTNDGQMHKTKEKAELHEMELFCDLFDLFDKRLDSLQKQGRINADQRIPIVISMIGSSSELHELYEQMKKIFEDKPFNFNK